MVMLPNKRKRKPQHWATRAAGRTAAARIRLALGRESTPSLARHQPQPGLESLHAFFAVKGEGIGAGQQQI